MKTHILSKLYNVTYPPLPHSKGSFQQSSLSPTVFSIIDDLLVLLPVLIGVAFVTVAERKTMGSMQRRLGPNIVGAMGTLQAFADALKLILKEYVSPTQANLILFFLGPEN
jgi:NADH:ubiquinone oxidoreductase subunit H